jgi:hypothetical protein
MKAGFKIVERNKKENYNNLYFNRKPKLVANFEIVRLELSLLSAQKAGKIHIMVINGVIAIMFIMSKSQLMVEQ